MKKTFTLTLLCMVFGAITAFAQIPNTSPLPVEVSTEAADGTVRVYSYASAADWMDTLSQTLTAELIWAYGLDSLGTGPSDSLLCDTMVHTDLEGKIALIQRGDCEFGWKALRAQMYGAVGFIIINHTYEGDPSGDGGLVNMGGGVYGAEVSIPGVFLTRESGDLIKEKLDNGIAMTATFEVSPFSQPRSAYSYHTPKDAIVPLADMGVTYFNLDPVDPLPTVTFEAVITDPNGQTTTLTKEVTDLPPLTGDAFKFDDTYTPEAVGTYTVVYTNSLSPDELTSEFVITENTFAMDNGDIVPNTNGTIEPSDENFVDLYAFKYDMGNVYRTGANEIMATHASFMISNPDELYTGSPEEAMFNIRLFDADPDGNGSVPYPASFINYNGLNESGGPTIPIESAEYFVEEDDQGFEFMTVEFDDPVTLGPNKLYLLMVQFDGLSSGLGIPPKYAFGGNERPAGEVGTMIFTDSLHTDGWGNNYNGVIRLHLDGFVDAEETALDENKISLSPNPASNVVNLNLDLENVADLVTVRILDFNGSLIEVRELENVKNGTFNFNVGNLANGNYFMSVSTPEGYRSKKFQVLR